MTATTDDQRKLLERISDTLFTSVDHTITLKKVADLIVPSIADYCRIMVLDRNEQIQEITVSHKNPARISLASELYEQYKNLKDGTHGIPHILRSGKAELMSEITPEVLEPFKQNSKLMNTIQSLELKSYMGIPLTARSKVIGALTFSSSKPGRHYTEKDLQFAKEIGKRVALALDNSRLYREAQEEIQERKLTEEKLRGHQDRLELIQTAVNMGTFEFDMKNDRLYWSPELKMLYGLSPSATVEKTADWEKMVYPEDVRRMDREMKDQLKIRDVLEFEFRIKLPDNSTRWIYSKSKVFLTRARRPIRSVGINMDITQRKTMETNLSFLAEASKVLSSSLDYQTTLRNVASLAVPVIADWCAVDILDEKGNIQQVAIAHKNPKKVKWALQLRKTQPPDRNSATGIPHVLRTGKPELYPYISEEMLKSTAKSKSHFKMLKKLALKSVMLVPLFSRGVPIGCISFITTETSRYFNASDLSVAEELASRASMAIDNARLYKGSQEAISLRDDFISIASHELKTPVTSVKIFAQVLKQHSEQIGDNKAVAYFKKMDKQLNRLTELIYNLLNISRIQAGRMEYKEKYFAFDTLIKEVVDVMQQSAPNHRLIIQGKAGRRVYGDEDRIGQVVSNLVANAVKYSPGADKVVIRVTRRRGNVVVAVQDFGIGIVKEHLARIFERFYRVYDTKDKTFPGLGIGLYISSEIIKRHKGKLWVESETGQGSTFYFSIPMTKKT